MVARLLPGVKIDGADAADALAVAICHAHHLASAGACQLPHRRTSVHRAASIGAGLLARHAMIAHLKGRLDSTGIDHAVIDVGGVGYLVGASAQDARGARPGRRGGDAPHRDAGRARISSAWSASPRAERARLVPPADRRAGRRRARRAGDPLGARRRPICSRAIAAQDKAMVARANGVGPKLAERIVRELKDKVGGVAIGGGGAPVARRAARAPMRCRRCSTSASGPPRPAPRSRAAEEELGAGATSMRWCGWRCGRRRSEDLRTVESAAAARAICTL